ncbi:MAG: NAD-dependent epimerase/dehydratase family protein [Ruminococcaceae bacterium]|jgi:nucleoside-diphosphate-sugar epimerase|nr:NAD-dependent epimerase/dehydratase family protein [Oscillospiraceae bacterium]
MKHAIVTGANGFVGSAVVRELLANGVNVTAIVHKNHRDSVPEQNGLNVFSCDLDELKELCKILPQTDYDTFYHFAWSGSAGQQRADTALQLNNAQWTVDALRTAKELGCGRFLCAGSIMEHETMAAAYTQGNRPGPAYIYGGGKLISHVMCMSVAAQIGIDLIWPEITNAYGPGERSPRLVNTTIQKCIRAEEPQFTSGTQNYDFVYIDDLARAFRLIGEKGKPFHEYLIGSGTARPLRQFLEEMRDAIAPELTFRFGDVPFTGVDLPISCFDCSETERDTGFRAEICFGEGCRRTLEWWKEQGRQ